MPDTMVPMRDSDSVSEAKCLSDICTSGPNRTMTERSLRGWGNDCNVKPHRAQARHSSGRTAALCANFRVDSGTQSWLVMSEINVAS
jgi:hypothetical protein